MANEKLFYVGIKGLIRNKKGQYLLLEADVSTHSINTAVYWDIPGGRIKQGSDAISTLRREIEEETGITELYDITFLNSVISHHEIPLDDSRKAGLVLMIYTVRIADDAIIKLSKEHTSYEWASVTEAANRLSNKYPEEFTSQLT